MKKIKQNEYCGECGAKLLVRLVGAETLKESYYLLGIGDLSYRIYKPYNKQTGQRQYVKRFYCPKTRWYNSHTDFSLKELVTY